MVGPLVKAPFCRWPPLYPLMAERGIISVSRPIRASIPFIRAPPSWLTVSQRSHLKILTHQELQLQYMSLRRGCKHSVLTLGKPLFLLDFSWGKVGGCLLFLFYLHGEIVRTEWKHCEILGGDGPQKFLELFRLLKWSESEGCSVMSDSLPSHGL